MADEQDVSGCLMALKDDLEGHNVQKSLIEPGLLNINNELHIAPNKLVQISNEDRDKILDATRQVEEFTMDDNNYQTIIEKILKKNRLKMEYQRRDAISRLKEAFCTDDLKLVKIGNEYIFKDMTPSELDRIADVMAGSCKNYDPKILNIANNFASMRSCTTPRDYCNYVEFTSNYLNDLKRQYHNEYKTDLKAKNARLFDERQFEQKYKGIKEQGVGIFMDQVFNNFSTKREESLKTLEQHYLDLERSVVPVNSIMFPNFTLESAAVYHFFKHSVFDSKKVTVQKYFEIACELVNDPEMRRSEQLNQQGDRWCITFTNPITGAVGVVFEKLDGRQSIATVYYDKKVKNQFDD